MFGLSYKALWAASGALIVAAWGGSSVLVAQAAGAPVIGGDFFSNGTWMKAGLLLGVMTGAFYALARRLVGYAVDRVIRSWEGLEVNQEKFQVTLDKLGEELRVHIAIEREWQRGIEQRLGLQEIRK